MSQNTDPFPTPRGALSPEGVSARVPESAKRWAWAREHPLPLGVPETWGGELAACRNELQAARERERVLMDYIAAEHRRVQGAVPEPQGPTTEAVNRMARVLIAEWERVEGPLIGSSYIATFADLARAALREARAAAPPDIDVERLREALAAAHWALVMWVNRDDKVYLSLLDQIEPLVSRDAAQRADLRLTAETRVETFERICREARDAGFIGDLAMTMEGASGPIRRIGRGLMGPSED